MFSAKLAWQRPVFRFTSVIPFVVCLAASIVFLLTLIPSHVRGGMLVMHYNVYLGIDEVHPWPYIIILPSVWLMMTIADLFIAYGIFRKDPQLAWSLNVLAILFALPWCFALFYLTRMNV